MSEMTDADFVEHMHDLHLKCVAPSFDDGNRLMTIARRCVDATEVTARLIAERDTLTAEVKRLKAVEADYDDHERAMIDLEEDNARLTAEVEKLREEIKHSRQEHAILVENLDEDIERLRGQAEFEKKCRNDAFDELKKQDAENEKLRAALNLYREAVRVDVTMEGPKFMGLNGSALKRAWDADRATLEGKQ